MVDTKSKQPTTSLTEDHVSVLLQLDRIAAAAKKLGEPEIEEAKREIGEVAAFFDRELEIHLRKEEDALFPPLEAIIGATGGPTAVMRYEHEDLRANLKELHGMVADFGDTGKTSQNLKKLQGVIYHICDVLGPHIHKEDFILFPMANEALTPEDLEKVAAKMREIDGR